MAVFGWCLLGTVLFEVLAQVTDPHRPSLANWVACPSPAGPRYHHAPCPHPVGLIWALGGDDGSAATGSAPLAASAAVTSCSSAPPAASPSASAPPAPRPEALGRTALVTRTLPPGRASSCAMSRKQTVYVSLNRGFHRAQRRWHLNMVGNDLGQCTIRRCNSRK